MNINLKWLFTILFSSLHFEGIINTPKINDAIDKRKEAITNEGTSFCAKRMKRDRGYYDRPELASEIGVKL